MLSAPLASLSLLLCRWGAILSLGSDIIIEPSFAFAPISVRISPPAKFSASSKWHISQSQRSSRLFDSSNEEDESLTESNDSIPPTASSNANDNSLFQRFLSPQIDDPGLPLTDVLLAQIVAPTFQIYWLLLNHAPNPSWLQPIGSYFGEAPELAPRGSLLAPTLIHGAGLAVCWLAGALAAKMYEREAFSLKEIDSSDGRMRRSPMGVLDEIGRYDTILLRLVKAGAFASGILIFSTQLDLLLEFKRYVQYGESGETDLRLLVATVEVINDIFWSACVIGSWRLIHASFMSSPDNRMKRF
ncbi:hypothetical protein ACHAXR_013034 [Thalassiosira sp. AJA248-18]